MSLHIVKENIVEMKTDAIVNAANKHLNPGSGVCGAVYAAAGYDELFKACMAIGGCETGKAVITPGFRLTAKYIIHTVGPVWQGGLFGEEEQLASCYKESLKLAEAHDVHSISFPLLSSGIYGYPVKEAMRVAVSAIRAFLETHTMDVYLVLYDEKTYRLAQEFV